MKIRAANLGFPEAPVLLPDGSMLVVEMDPAKGWVVRISSDGKTRSVVARTGRPNGLARDRNGFIWVAETAMHALLKMDLAGKFEVVAKDCNREPFLFMNDLAFASNGDLYFTDSGILLETFEPGGRLAADFRSLKYDGRVFRVDMKTLEVQLIDCGLQFANGIAFGPDGDLYVAETLSGMIYQYRCENGLVAGERTRFGNVIARPDPAQLQGPDGMKFGADGKLYVAVFGQGDVTVLDSSGTVVKRFKTEGSMPTNLAFGRKGERRIYVTEVETGTLQVLDVDSEGLPLNL